MIPLILGFYLYRAKEKLPFRSIFILFISFILACGLTHLMDAVIFWWPAYGLSAVIRFATAVVSLGTVFALVKITPEVLKFKSPQQLEKLINELTFLNERLHLEIKQREAAEAELRRLNEELERKVEDRTADLQQSNQNLKRINDLFRSAQKAAGIGIWEVDLERQRVFFSREVNEIYNVDSQGPLTVQECLQYIHSEDRQAVLKLARKAVAKGIPYDKEIRIITGDKKMLWSRAVGIPVKPEDEVVALRGLIMNIDPLKTSQQKIEESRRVLTMALEAGEIGVWHWHIKENKLEWDDYMHQLFDYPKAQFKGTLDEFMQRIHQDDTQKVNKAIAVALEREVKLDVTFRIRTGQGKIRIIQSKGEVITDDQGNAESIVGLSINITAAKAYEETLKESEQRFRAAVDYSPIGVALVSLKGKLFKVNQALASMLNYSEKELLNLDFSEITHPSDVNSDAKQIKKLLQGRIASFQADKRYLRKDGKSIWIQLNVSLVKDANKEPKYFIAQILDITERKMAEEKIQETVRQRTAQLEAMNQELEAFSYSVSHDLRSPLRSIHGFSQALLEDYATSLDEMGNDYLNRVSAASVRMGHLIDDLLALARITRQDMKIDIIDVSEVAEQVATALKAERYQNTEFIIKPGLKAHADQGLLTVALENLFENAAKYSRVKDHPKVEFGEHSANGKNTFFIKDNGVGFDMQYADKLFGAFQRLHTAKEFEGTGIGLATVKRVIHRHGGEIWAESELGVGSCFYFTLT
ncbi:PAS domain-containing sensor histidine kinase [Fulvivirga imtechensis]|nr:PAS domain-containing protein [Fulvivirga imtechensis]